MPTRRQKKRPSRRHKTKLRTLWKTAWRLQSTWLRRSSTNANGQAQCYTCYRWFDWHDLQAGHYIHGALDFDLDNLKPQCPHCNHHLHGNLGAYAEHLTRNYGLAWLMTLRQTAAQVKNGYKRADLEASISRYRELLAKM